MINYSIFTFYYLIIIFSLSALLGYPILHIQLYKVPLIELSLIVYMILSIFFIKKIKVVKNFKNEIYLILLFLLYVFIRGITQFSSSLFALRDASHYIDLIFIFSVLFMRYFNTRIVFWILNLIFLSLLAKVYIHYFTDINPDFSITTIHDKKINLLSLTTAYIFILAFCFAVKVRCLLNRDKLSFLINFLMDSIILVVLLLSSSRSIMILCFPCYLIYFVTIFVINTPNIKLNFKSFFINLSVLIISFSCINILNSNFEFDKRKSNIDNLFFLYNESVNSLMYGYKFFNRMDVNENTSLYNRMDVNENTSLYLSKKNISGVKQRIIWFKDILSKNTSNVYLFLFGQGFGHALTSTKIKSSITIREPHNSILSTFARLGFVGFIFILSIWLLLYKKLIIIYIDNLKKRTNKEFFSFFVLFLFTSVCTFSLFQDAFEKSYFASIVYISIAMLVSGQQQYEK